MAEISAAGTRLLALVDDVLQISEADSGLIDMDIADVLVDDVVAEAVERVTAAAARRHVAIAVEPTHGARLRADRGLLRDALVQLLANAVAVEPDGGSVAVAFGAIGAACWGYYTFLSDPATRVIVVDSHLPLWPLTSTVALAPWALMRRWIAPANRCGRIAQVVSGLAHISRFPATTRK